MDISIQEKKNQKNVLHIVAVSFAIKHFFGDQFKYLRKKTGNQYFLACSPSEEFNLLSKELDYKKFPVEITRRISPILDLKAIYLTYKFIKANNIDTVVGHTPKGGMVAMIAAFFARVDERIYFRHGIIYETSKGLKKTLLKNIDRLSGKLAKKVVCVSASVRQISIEDKLNNPNKNMLLGLGTCNGVDSEVKYNPQLINAEEKEKLRKQLNISEDDIVLGYVGRLVKDKGINELIDAWKLLENKYTNLKLLLVGPFEERDSIDPSIKEEIINNDRIINTGLVSNTALYFSIMDIFILPTYREGFPTVSLEASSMKLPVLITRATGCTESIIEDKTGIFVLNDGADIAKKIEKYMKDKNLRILHGANGREFVRENFEQSIIWNIIAKELNY